jgi:hypothetical protein
MTAVFLPEQKVSLLKLLNPLLNNSMKRILVVIFLTSISVVGMAQTPEQTVLDLSKKKFGWMIRMKFDSLETVLDDRLMFVHSNGWTETKQELMEDIKSGKLRYVSVDVTESSVRMYPAMAIVTGKGKFRVLLDESPLEIILSYTEVYTHRGGRWLLASRHSNRMP